MKTAARIVINNETGRLLDPMRTLSFAIQAIGYCLKSGGHHAVVPGYMEGLISAHGDGFGNWEVNILPHEEEKR